MRRSDLWRVCEHDGWINDIVIIFRETPGTSERRTVSTFGGEPIDPNVAHFLQHGDILDAAQLLKDLELDGSKLFCLPVNDETDLSLRVGGCHWSLTAHAGRGDADIPARWSHIDSMSHKNIPARGEYAKQIAKGLLINEGRGSYTCPPRRDHTPTTTLR